MYTETALVGGGIQPQCSNSSLPFLSPCFSQNDIQSCVEWGGAVCDPQPARVQGQSSVHSWDQTHYSLLLNCLFSFFQPDLNEEVFTQFTDQLLTQGPQFTKSVKFAKMMLTVLTKYSSHVSFQVYIMSQWNIGWHCVWALSACFYLCSRWRLHTNTLCPVAWRQMKPSWKSLFKLLWKE